MKIEPAGKEKKDYKEKYYNFKFTKEQAKILFNGLDMINENDGRFPYNEIATELHSHLEDLTAKKIKKLEDRLKKLEDRVDWIR